MMNISKQSSPVPFDGIGVSRDQLLNMASLQGVRYPPRSLTANLTLPPSRTGNPGVLVPADRIYSRRSRCPGRIGWSGAFRSKADTRHLIGKIVRSPILRHARSIAHK